MEKDCKSTPQDTVDDGSTVVGGGIEKFERFESSKGCQSEQEGGSDQREQPLASPGRDQREQPFRTVQNPSEPTSDLEERVRADCRRSCRRNFWIELFKSAAKIAGVVLAALGLSQDFTIEKLMRSHRARGFGTYPGYHLYVRRDGSLYYCRPIAERGCHVKGHNAFSIGICYEGGHSCSPEYKYEDNRTAEQMVVLDEVLKLLHEVWPEARIVGHCELNPCKACPCLDPPASVEYAYIFH